MQGALLEKFLTDLTSAINGLKVSKMPPPAPYHGYGNINDFFLAFEAYCESLYGVNNTAAYLTVLPSFLEGESKAIVQAHDNQTEYATVKQKLIETMTSRKTLGSSTITDLLSAKRLPNESLLCFSIRLENIGSRIPQSQAGEDIKSSIVKAKFLDCLDSAIACELNVRFANSKNISLFGSYG